jgi:hypothetical protein
MDRLLQIWRPTTLPSFLPEDARKELNMKSLTTMLGFWIYMGLLLLGFLLNIFIYGTYYMTVG